jgi:hypothetical protein
MNLPTLRQHLLKIFERSATVWTVLKNLTLIQSYAGTVDAARKRYFDNFCNVRITSFVTCTLYRSLQRERAITGCQPTSMDLPRP